MARKRDLEGLGFPVLGQLTRPIGHIIYKVFGNFEQDLLHLRIDSFPRRDLREHPKSISRLAL
jgi:hypothetical protein